MNILRTTSIICLTLVLNVANLRGNVSRQKADPSQRSHIIGLVVDKNDTRIADASIRIENKDFRQQLRSDDEGKFELDLPPGIYQITVLREGFKRFRLSSFRANAGVRELMNIHMEVAPPQSPLKIS